MLVRDAVSERWRTWLSTLPGYDPFRDADGYVFDEDRADRVITFFSECLRHVKGPLGGQPIRLEAWQRGFLGALFGFVDAAGLRRYRSGFLFVPRKNSKTTMAAGIALYLLACDGEFGAEVYAGAASKEQASITYTIAAGMVRQEPELASRGKCYRAFKSIEWENGGIFRALCSIADLQHGLNVSGYVVDELHAHKDASLSDALETGTAARAQPLGITITTADYDRPSACNSALDYARKVRDGVVREPTHLPAIWETLPDADWTDPVVWRRANPNLGVSVPESYLAAKCRKARDEPAFENEFKRLHLNMRTEQAHRWMPLEAWDRPENAAPFTDEDLAGLPCWGGLDLSQTRDLTAFAIVWRERKDGVDRIFVRAWTWCAGERIREAVERDRVPYDLWQRDGFLQLAGERVIDYDPIKTRVRELAKRYRLCDVGYDPYNAQDVANALEGEGVAMFRMSQGYGTYTEPVKQLLRLAIDGRLRHGGNPVLRWCASNVAVKMDELERQKPSKAHSKGRIDAVVATLMAFGRALVTPEPKPSPYATRGLPG